MADTLVIFGETFTGVTGIKATDSSDATKTYIRPEGTKSITANGTGIDVAAYASVDVAVSGGSSPSLQAKTNISPTTSSQTITADNGYDGLSSVQINAMPSGTAGTPSATKGTVSNHAISVTPSVTNTTGYITGGTKTGTAVTVSASELVSGSETKTANGTYDVTNLASLVVNVSGGGSASIDTKTVTASNYPVSISFTSMKGEPKAFFLRSTSQIASSGNTTYYYVIALCYDGNTDKYCDGSCFRIGGTRRVDPITTSSSGGTVTGYTWSYSGTTLTITSSAASRSASPGSFNNGYQLVYVY